jgi:aminoglycoside 3-N-acetyltransferase
MYSRDELSAGFRRLGVTRGDLVMLHASIRAVGSIAGGPDQIHLALKDALTPEGTLVMYASCPQHVDEIGRGNLTAAEERELLEKLPAFDPLTARAQRENGALVELFRTYPESRVNEHVARFVVWGSLAPRLLSPQPWDYAFGAGSLLERFVEGGGRILLLGCDHDAVTFLHYAEHVAPIAGKRVVTFKVPVEENGCRVWREMHEFDTSVGAHPNWPPRFFAQIVDRYLAITANAAALVGDGRAYLIEAHGLLDFALHAMEVMARDVEAGAKLLSGAVISRRSS